MYPQFPFDRRHVSFHGILLPLKMFDRCEVLANISRAHGQRLFYNPLTSVVDVAIEQVNFQGPSQGFPIGAQRSLKAAPFTVVPAPKILDDLGFAVATLKSTRK